MGSSIGEVEFLRCIFGYDHPPSISDLNDSLPVCKSSISRRVSRYCDKGLLEKKGSDQGGSRVLIYLTEEGKDRIIEASECQNNVNGVSNKRTSNGGRSDEFFIHNFQVECEIKNSEMLDSSWRERLYEYDDLEFNHYRDFDEVKITYNEFHFRISNDQLHVRVLDELKGDDVRALKDKMIDRVRDAVEFIEDRLPLRVSDTPVSWRIESQHIGHIENHLIRWLDRDGYNISNFRVNEDDGSLRLWADRSKDRRELEGGNGGSPSGMRETPEDDMAFLEEWVYALVDNKDEVNDLFNLRPDLEDVSGDVDDIKMAVRMLLAKEINRSDNGEVNDYDNPVQNKFMEIWRSSEYSRPFFHKDSGGLMAFRSDGSGCVKIFSGDEVERLS